MQLAQIAKAYANTEFLDENLKYSALTAEE